MNKNENDESQNYQLEQFTVLFITRGKGCALLPGSEKLKWYKRVHNRSGDEGKIIKSSDELISSEQMEEAVHFTLQNVEQVLTDDSESNSSTAQKFFPHITPDFIRFKDRVQFDFKLRTGVFSDVIAVIVSPDQLTMITGIDDNAYFAIHAVEYQVIGDKLEMIRGDLVSHGTDHSYGNQVSDAYQCNIDEDSEMLKHYRRVVKGNYCNWLKLIRDDVQLYKLRILQSHDTSTGYMNYFDRTTWKFAETKFLPGFVEKAINKSDTIAKWSITQSMTIEEQLAAGVRSFDLRVHTNKNNEIWMHHGAIIIKVNFFDIVQILLKFISEHPSEFIYILLKISGDGNKDEIWNKFVNICDTKLILPNSGDNRQLTVGDVRGKLLAWSANPMFSGTNNDIISYYKTFSSPGCKGELNEIARDWSEFEQKYMPCFPLEKDKDTLFVFQLHNQVDFKKIRSQKGGGAIMASSRRFNAQALKWLKTYGNSRNLNVIEMDYIKTGFISTFIWNLNKSNLKNGAKEMFSTMPEC